MKFNEPFLFLNDKLTDIDNHIASANFYEAKKIIDEVLENAPGMKIDLPNGGEMLNSGEVHWKKLLVEIECKNDEELFYKGKPLADYPSFENAKNYGTETEKIKYCSIEEKKKLILAELLKSLKKQELKQKQDKRSNVSLNDFQKELEKLIMHTREKFIQLEEIELSIQEQMIDYMSVVGEYENFFGYILSKVKNVGEGRSSDNISIEERDQWIEQLDEWLMRINHEANNLADIKTSNVYFQEYSRLKSKGEVIVSEIKTNISKITALQPTISSVLNEIALITEEYVKAKSDLENGNYVRAINLISQDRFYEIVKQVKSEKKSGDN